MIDECVFSTISVGDCKEIIDIFNYYIEHSFAAYPEQTVSEGFSGMIMAQCAQYPSVTVKTHDGTIVGFGLLHAHNPMPAFSRSAEITYFIRPDMTGKGIGTGILAFLETEAKKGNISVLLANISSKNNGSIRFHQKNGFIECGRFRNVGEKKGVIFDTVWMQKEIDPPVTGDR
jgi:L-amino acid N-acyltransferase YncA